MRPVHKGGDEAAFADFLRAASSSLPPSQMKPETPQIKRVSSLRSRLISGASERLSWPWISPVTYTKKDLQTRRSA